MEEIIQNQGNIIYKFYEQELFPVLFKRIVAHNEAIIKIVALQKVVLTTSYTNRSKVDVLADLALYKKSLGVIVSSYFVSDETNTEEAFFNTYYEILGQHTHSLDVILKREQDKERFYAQASDKPILKFKKGVKRTAFKFSKIPAKFVNIFKKNKKEIPFWSHKIPFRNTTHHYFKTVLTRETQVVINDIYKEISEITNLYWLIDKIIDKKTIGYINEGQEISFLEDEILKIEALPQLMQRIEKHTHTLKEVFKTTFDSYKETLYKVDTLEISSTGFSTKKIGKLFNEAKTSTQKNHQQWGNTYNVLKSDWELDIEIYITIFKVLTKYIGVENEISSRSVIINSELDTIKDYVEEAKQKIEKSTTTQEIKKNINEELSNLSKKLKKKIRKATTCVNDQELPVLINEFEEHALSVLKDISTKKAINIGNDYLAPTNTAAINYISPYELITYESWPLLFDKIKKAKIELTIKLNNFIDDVTALSQVAEFNLESALSLFESASQDNTPKTVALEGLQRTTDKTEDLKTIVSNIHTANNELLLPGIEKFNESILALTDTENIIDIKLKIAKAKSIEKSKQFRQKLIDTVKNFIPIALAVVATNTKKIKNFVKGFLLRYGLYKEPTEISTDLSNFLKEAEKALDALPYVYQRLFRSETFQNEDLFIGREKSLEVLSVAYNAFKKDQYASTIVTGERGAGKTSLIHYFLQNTNNKLPVIFLSPKETMSTKEDLNEFLNSSFSQNFESKEQWFDFFNKGGEKIIIIENIQYLYCRKINGFDALGSLGDLVSNTKKSIFWLLTCSKHAFDYLNKSIQLSELFSFTITMDDLDKKTMTNALIKRHRISGYNLHFEKPPEAYLTKKFIKSPTDIQQQLLREEFFSDINKIAQSNFKIAFMYWIRCATSVSGSTINMRSLKTMDLSFLNKLAPLKLMLLNIILLHERLTVEAVIELMGLDDQQVRRMVHSLYEDGLLLIDDNCYSINILLYRQITALLKSKNLIH